MPRLTIHGAEIDYTDSAGKGPPIVFSHGLLWDRRLFDAQVEHFRQQYRCIAYDHRGQGRSTAGPETSGSISIDTVYEDAVGLIEQLGIAPCHFVGLSMGGFVGLRLAARRPDLLRSCTLVDSSADAEPHTRIYKLLNGIGRWLTPRLSIPHVMKISFGQTYLHDPANQAQLDLWRQRVLENDRSIWRAVHGAIERPAMTEELANIAVPTLIVVGDEDVVTPPAAAERMHHGIAGSRLVILPKAGHLTTVEQPDEVNRVLESFLASLTSHPEGAQRDPRSQEILR